MPQARSLEHPLTGRLLRAAAAATRMKRALSRFSLAALGVVALYRAPAVAHEQARAQAIQVYDGELSSDPVTDTPASSRTQYRIVGEAYAQPVGMTYGDGISANLGIATKSYVTTNLFWDLGIHYGYLDRVVSLENTLLTTAGAGAA